MLTGRGMAQVVDYPGTWMDMTHDGRFAALMNYRVPSKRRPDTCSREELVSNLLMTDDMSVSTYLGNLATRDRACNGHDLLTTTRDEL